MSHPASYVLVLADWRADPYAVVAECRRHAAGGAARFALVVPAWLHGLDWAGDPHASRPCAERQLEALAGLAARAGLAVDLTTVGDPDPSAAADDALHEFPATEILVCRDRAHRHPMDLSHRLHRLTGLPVQTPGIRTRSPARERRRWRALLHGGHCVPEVR